MKAFYHFLEVFCLCFLLYLSLEVGNRVIPFDLLTQDLLTTYLKGMVMNNKKRRRSKFDEWLGSQKSVISPAILFVHYLHYSEITLVLSFSHN